MCACRAQQIALQRAAEAVVHRQRDHQRHHAGRHPRIEITVMTEITASLRRARR